MRRLYCPAWSAAADVTLFPVDCISHNAMTSAKRACQQLGKPYLALRTSSVACLLSALIAVRPPVANGTSGILSKETAGQSAF